MLLPCALIIGLIIGRFCAISIANYRLSCNHRFKNLTVEKTRYSLEISPKAPKVFKTFLYYRIIHS